MSRVNTPFNLNPLYLEPAELRTLEKITIPDVFDGHSQVFHDQGLFSTRIFGNVGTEQRDNTFAYIDIKLTILHPFMLKIVTQLRGFYKDLMAGKSYATWDAKEKDFVLSNALDGQTGFYFFLQHWKEIKFKRTTSKLRDEKIKFYEKFKDIAELDKVIVYPAGLRDVQVDETGRVKKDEVNDYYVSLIGISNSIADDASRRNTDLLDTTRLSLQNTFNKIYEHFNTLIEGKGGSIQKKWASRNIYYGTRNVITPFNAEVVNVLSPAAPSANNSAIGLFQMLNTIMPLVQSWMISYWSNRVFSNTEGAATLINTETLKPELVKLAPDIVDRWTTSAGIEDLIENFQYPKLRTKPVKIDGRYLALIYQNKHYFKVMFSIDELPDDPAFSPKDVHPITYMEMFYLAGYQKWNQQIVFPTRYPIEGNGSIYPSYAFLRTTLRDFQLYELEEDWTPKGEEYLALSYPDINSSDYMDAMSMHPSHLGAAGAD